LLNKALIEKVIVQKPLYFYGLLFVSLFFLALIAYWPSFSVPFYLDDRLSLVENKFLENATIVDLWQFYKLRFVGYFSFWLNVNFLDRSLLSFHLFNYFIHFLNAILVFLIVKLLATHFKISGSSKQILAFSFVVAGLWLLHPLNTQAVTYIVQRLASLVTLFYLITVYSYFKLRFEKFNLVYAVSLIVSILLGALTKQNFFAVALFLLAYELVFLKGSKHRALVQNLLCLGLIIALIYPFAPAFFQQLSNLTAETKAISRFDYFVTQTSVLWIYIQKFLLPINLQLDMAVNLAKPSTGWNFIALVAHLFTISLAIRLRKTIPLFTIGILFFYTGHAIESFLIPITDLAFEHRTYLPNIGLSLALCAVIFHFSNKDNNNLLIASIVIFIIFILLTFHRNTLWQTPYDFYQNEFKLSPNSPRTQSSLAIELIKKKEYAQAEKLLTKAVNTNLSKGVITVTSLNNLMLLLFEQKKYQAAVNTAMIALKYIKRPKEKSLILSTISYGYIKMGWCGFASGLAKKAIKLDNTNQKAKQYVQYCMK